MNKQAKVALWVFIVALILSAIPMYAAMLFPVTQWRIIESPRTGHCYEQRTSYYVIGSAKAMAQIDDKYCDEKEGTE